MSTAPCTNGARHKWVFVKNVNVGSMSVTARGTVGRFSLKGLYRCAFLEPMSGHNVQAQIDDWNHPGLSLEQALHRFYSGLLAPLEQSVQHVLAIAYSAGLVDGRHWACSR